MMHDAHLSSDFSAEKVLPETRRGLIRQIRLTRVLFSARLKVGERAIDNNGIM
jgi:hypothetical protein